MTDAMLPNTIDQILERIRKTQSPLRRQLLMLALISRILTEAGLAAPVLVGGAALAYYTREVYFTADIDLAYADRDILDQVLCGIGFVREGRYWIHRPLDLMVEAPAASLPGEDAPRETVELGGGLECTIIGIEDLLIDRMNACRHWNFAPDCEMVELLLARYADDIDWDYLLRRAALPENDTAGDFRSLRKRQT